MPTATGLTTTATMMSAADRGWGPGWPRCQRDQLVTLRRSDDMVLPVRAEVAPMVMWLCDETERRGYDLRPGQCWGFACRPVRGSRTPSNHSWGLAVDLNAAANPMADRLITDMPPWMPELWEAHGWRWGGRYTRRPDAMHFEYMGTPAGAEAWCPPIGSTVTPQEVEMAYGLLPGHTLAVPGGRPNEHGQFPFWSWDEGGSVYAWNGAPAVLPTATAKAAMARPIVAMHVRTDGVSGYYLVGSVPQPNSRCPTYAFATVEPVNGAMDNA